jgi:DNA-binding response OmpR family regulator
MKKILFVEDEATLQEALGDFLTQKGYKIIKALDGETGVRLAKSEKPDLILLDMIIPYKSGFEVLEELKEEEDTKNIPVIVLTNLEGMKDIDKALSVGATNYLVKTRYSLKEVLEKINKILG